MRGFRVKKKNGDIMKKTLSLGIFLIICIVFSVHIISRGNSISSYVGKTYEGVTPWGAELNITVNSYDGSAAGITLEEIMLSKQKTMGIYEGPIINNNVLILHNSGEITENSEIAQYEYSRKIEFVDDTIIVTYIDGQVICELSDGQRETHRVETLSNDEKTVVLKHK